MNKKKIQVDLNRAMKIRKVLERDLDHRIRKEFQTELINSLLDLRNFINNNK